MGCSGGAPVSEHLAGLRRQHMSRLEERENLRPSGGVPEAHQGECRIASDHQRRIIEHLKQGLVKAGAGGVGVLAHHPSVGVTHFVHGIRRQANDIRIPAGYASIVPADTLANLHQGVLDVPRLLVVLEIFGHSLVRKLAAKPGVPPEQKPAWTQ
jgi:hypothetical protein